MQSLTQHEIVSLFATPDDGLRVQDRFLLAADSGSLIGVNVPNLFFVRLAPSADASTSLLLNKPMRDFVGLDSIDQAMINSLLEFRFVL